MGEYENSVVDQNAREVMEYALSQALRPEKLDYRKVMNICLLVSRNSLHMKNRELESFFEAILVSVEHKGFTEKSMEAEFGLGPM